MDHITITEKEIIERYILKQLPTEEENFFEEHILECEQCFNEIQASEKIIMGLKDASEKGLLKVSDLKEKESLSMNNFLNVFSFPPALAIAATILICILIYPAWQGFFTISQLEEEIINLKSPKTNIQNYFLETTRSEQDVPVIKMRAISKNESFIMNFNILEKSIPNPKYNAEIIDQDGKQIWKTENLKGIGDYEVFTIICSSSFFETGEYLLIVNEIHPKDNININHFDFSFKIVFN